MAREGVRARKRKDGTTAYLAYYRDATGKVQSKTFNTEKAAGAHRNKMLSEIAEGIVHGDKKITFAELCARFLETYNPKRESTWIHRERVIRTHLVPTFGSLKLSALTGARIDLWLAECRTKPMVRRGRAGSGPPNRIAGARTVQTWINTLRMVLRQAVKWRLIPRSPLDDATPPPSPGYDTVPHWREEEAAKFFAHDPGHQDWPLWVVLATCQLRISEAVVLRGGEVDLERGVLRVERGLSEAKDGGFVETGPKTASSRRTVTLPPESVAALIEQRERQETRRRALGRLWRGEVPGYIFDSGYGQRCASGAVRKRFDKAQREAGVPRITPHSLRHSGATAMARAGMPVRVLQDRLGHANPTITQMVYSHWLTEDQAPHADAFASRILGKRGMG